MDILLKHLKWEMVLCLLVSAFIARVAIPSIVRIASVKGMVLLPGSRTSYKGPVPCLGGISIFTSLIISTSLFVVDGYSREFQFIIPAILILFFIGLKNDITGLRMSIKQFGLVVASLIIIVFADVRIYSLKGMFGIYDLSLVASYVVSLVAFMVVISSINLIDSIDGLLSGMGIQISIAYGFWLAFLQYFDYAVLAFALAGGLIPFYFFNVFGKKYKLFMGESGSFLLGLVFAVLAIKILNCDIPQISILYVKGLPVLVASVMIIPLTDTILVIIGRIAGGESPFKANGSHFHHQLSRLGMKQWKVSLLIVILNTSLFSIVFLCRQMDILKLGLLAFGMAFSVLLVPRIMLAIRGGRMKAGRHYE